VKYRVIEDIEVSADKRFRVEWSPFGHTWTPGNEYPDQISAEIEMERLARGPRVIATAGTGEKP
jgi:hypothetical protein